MKYTQEQERSLQAAYDGHSFKQIARAGCGKTFICKEIGKVLKYTNEPEVLYVGFNKSVADEAAKSFTDNVYCTTFHGLALLSVDDRIQEKINFTKEPPNYLAQRLNIKGGSFVNPAGRLVTLSPTYMGRLVQKSVENFCMSADHEISKKHVEVPPGCEKDRADYIRERLFPNVLQYWQEQIDPEGTRGIIHGVYAKLWHLSKPNIDCTVIVDEGQDLDEVMLDIFKNTSGQTIWVGDDYQSIYGWRGAINALEKVDLPELQLTQSFRFGQTIGDLASSVLDLMSNKIPVRGLATKETLVDYDGVGGPPDVYLCRTNAGALQVLAEARERGELTALDSQALQEFSSLARSAEMLIKGTGRPIHPVLATFNNWNEFRDFTESPYGNEYRTLAGLIDNYGLDYLKKITSNVIPIDQAQNLVTTIHRFKGREAKKVQICEFVNHHRDENDKHVYANSKEELMLLYVALTRATEHLDVSVVREELAKLLRTVRPGVIAEVMDGKGAVAKPERQDVIQENMGLGDRTELHKHIKRADAEEKKNKANAIKTPSI